MKGIHMNDREYQKLKGVKILKRAGLVIQSITFRRLDGVLFLNDEPVFIGPVDIRRSKIL
uniref:Uncharacterized protein n=1 Tax=Siphoviridae sp. ctwNf2 TaxID=2827597 RepID=A0A8S5RR25_9CAUD|nr:MAG TPA: hypothetical protein [Siphoviridae sp. ctwNf2]